MSYDLYAIGNALVDTEFEVSDALLQSMGVSKGHMTLVDAAQRSQLLGHVQNLPSRRTGGGSAANTAVALAQLGGKAFYSCRVADDALGDFYAQDLRSHAVDSNLTHSRAWGEQTGSCMVLVTPDAQRTLCTFLGASSLLDASALHPQDIARSKIYYMEGYLAASQTGLNAALEGLRLARTHGLQTALTLSDVSMIDFCRPGLQAMLGQGVDYLFANEAEAQAWCASDNVKTMLTALQKVARVVCLTRGAQGCIVQREGHPCVQVPAWPTQAVDTNGAGDMFAGVFLYGMAHGMSDAQAAAWANRASSAVVAQHGNRLTRSLLQEILPI